MDYGLVLPCKHFESSGYQCEKYGAHRAHRVGEHTIRHALKGNGYTCEAIELMITNDIKFVRSHRLS